MSDPHALSAVSIGGVTISTASATGAATARTASVPAGLTKWAEVDVAALRDNTAAICRHVGDAVSVMAMVKANGYGHGMELAAGAALAGGARWLGVSSSEEALQLRDAGIDAAVLLTGWAHPQHAPRLIETGVDVTVFDASTLDTVVTAARALRRKARVHVKVDTGMGRLGARVERLHELCTQLQSARDEVEIVGVFTHFADAETDDAFTSEQHQRLLDAAATVRQLAPDALIHCANSAALLRHPDMWHDIVRPGIALYGYPPVADGAVSLRPAMTVLAHITQVRTLATGESVGYGRAWRAQRPTPIATVAAGYADGVLRSLSGRGQVLVRGRRCHIVGRVSMDQVSIDVSDAMPVAAGDVAVLFGVRDGARLDAAEVAAMVDTIPNEVLCAVSARVPRVAVGTEEG